MTELNKKWENFLKSNGVDLVFFVDTASLPQSAVEDYTCAVFFGKALSKEYIISLRAGEKPKPHEVHTIEGKMNRLEKKLTSHLEAEGYKAISKFKFPLLPHKTVALRAGIGFIGKNNLLVSEQYGCALMFGKVLTKAPFATTSEIPKEPQCGDCNICVDVCTSKSLRGKIWDNTTTRDEMMVRNLCNVCAKCMIWCPYTEKYIKS